MISDSSTNEKIIDVITNKKNDVKELIDQIQLGLFENNSGKTNQEEFEMKVNNILNQASADAGKIGLKNIEPIFESTLESSELSQIKIIANQVTLTDDNTVNVPSDKIIIIYIGY